MIDFKNVSNILVPIMFPDYTKLFYSHHNIKTLFTTVIEELNRNAQWFKANKLTLNIKKVKYTFFHKNSVKDEIPLKLTEQKIAIKIIGKKKSYKVFGGIA